MTPACGNSRISANIGASLQNKSGSGAPAKSAGGNRHGGGPRFSAGAVCGVGCQMADDDVTAKRLAEFVTLKEAGVREAIANKQWGEEKERLALAWLEMQRQELEAKVHAEQLTISRAMQDAAVESAAQAKRSADAAVESTAHSRRSADAAERSANTAKSANVIAGMALIVAIIAVLIAALHGK
jgi:hypothetical protein